MILTIGVKYLYGQDPEFSQFYNTPLYTNPANAGGAINTKDEQFATRIGLNYRNQWQSLKGSYQTVNASWDRQFNKLHGGLGSLLVRDVVGSGLLTTTSVAAIYAPTFRLNEMITLKGGVQIGYVLKSIDFNKLQFADQINPGTGPFAPTNEPPPTSNISFANFGLGTIAYIKNAHLGFAVHNLFEPNQSFYGNSDGNLPKRYTIHAAGRIQTFKQGKWVNYLTPYILYMKQQNFSQINLTTNYQMGRVLFGAGFRQTLGGFGNSDAVIGVIGYKVARFQFTYSYDKTVSSAAPAAKGSHEIGLIYLISLKKIFPDLLLTSPTY